MENTRLYRLSEDTIDLIFDTNYCFWQSSRAVEAIASKSTETENIFDYFGEKNAREKLRDELRIQIRLAFAGAKENELPLEALCDLLDEIDDLFCELWAESEEYRQNRKKVERDCHFWSSYLRGIEYAVQKQNTDVFFSLFANFKRELKHNGLEIPPTLGRLFRRALVWWDRRIGRTVHALLRIDDLQCDLLASARASGSHKTVAIANKIRKEWAHVKRFSPSLAA